MARSQQLEARSALLVTLPGYSRSARSDEEVEIRSFVSLQNVVDVQLLVAALCPRCRCCPGRASSSQFGLIDAKLQLAAFHVEFDFISIAYQCERATGRRLRRYVQDNSSIGRPAHARIGNAHQVCDPTFQKLFRN